MLSSYSGAVRDHSESLRTEIDSARFVMSLGKVYLVGAGPGHPELLTIKAARLLESCDVVVYDRLIQEEVLAYVKPSAERLYMGKAVGRHESRQRDICELLARKAGEGRMVVRLKGGDPFLFGRGGEEAEFLAGHGIPFEVIPGVSSALAAPLSAGIAVTHRDTASTVAIVTGHEASREESRMNWSALAGIDTVVFLMAVHSVDPIARELMAHGRDPSTPAAMIQMAYWHGEKVVTGTLATIGDAVERAGINPPATLVVGDAVRLREKLRQSQRDLCRRPDDAAPFQPAPAPDQLLRLAAAGIGSQVLLFALVANLFAHLEEWRTARDMARLLGMNSHGAGGNTGVPGFTGAGGVRAGRVPQPGTGFPLPAGGFAGDAAPRTPGHGRARGACHVHRPLRAGWARHRGARRIPPHAKRSLRVPGPLCRSARAGPAGTAGHRTDADRRLGRRRLPRAGGRALAGTAARSPQPVCAGLDRRPRGGLAAKWHPLRRDLLSGLLASCDATSSAGSRRRGHLLAAADAGAARSFFGSAHSAPRYAGRAQAPAPCSTAAVATGQTARLRDGVGRESRAEDLHEELRARPGMHLS